MLTTFKIKKLTMLMAAVSLGLSFFTHAQDVLLSALTAEESRIDKTQKLMPKVTLRLTTRVENSQAS